MDLTVRENQQNVVAGGTLLSDAVLLESLEARREVSGAREQNLHQGLVVDLHDAVDSGHVRSLRVAGQREAV